MTGQRTPHEHLDTSGIKNRAPSVPAMLRDRIAATPDAEAFRFPDNDEWTSLTWQHVGERVDLIAAGLMALGISPEDRVGLAAATRYEWVIADFAILSAGAATTTVYPSTNAEDVAFIIANSGSRIVIAEDQQQVDKLLAHRSELPAVEKIIIMDGTGDGAGVISLPELEQLGKQFLANSPTAVTDRIAGIQPDQLATVIYTSGTTGKPKGVRLKHEAWTYTAAAINSLGVLSDRDLNYLWLPLAHAFGKVMLALPLVVGFPTVIDGRVDKIIDNIAIIRPTFMAAVPRIFEKVHGRVMETVAEQGGVKKWIFDWALGIGTAVSQARQENRRVSPLLSIQHTIADRLVFSPIRQRFGGRLRFFISGAAALGHDVAQWFDAVGITVLEGYGLTETAAASSLNRLQANRCGTVGWPFPGTEIAIADDGEVLIKGPGVMSGYHDLPDVTAEVLDADGWFHTGDIGDIDAQGYLRITDRKKDMFKTSQGKYVAPSAIAAKFKGLCSLASEIIIYGESAPYCVALISLDSDEVIQWADRNGLQGKSFAEIARHEKTRAFVGGYIDTLNEQLNRWEHVKRFSIIDRELTVEAGDITPSLKLKRKVVLGKFQDELDKLYT